MLCTEDRVEYAPAVDTRATELVVADLAATARFWDPLMAFLGWRRADDGIGAVIYEGGHTAVVFTTGGPWDAGINDRHRVTPFAHLAFDVQSLDELTSLAASLARRAGTAVRDPGPVLDGTRWWWMIAFSAPGGLEVEVRCPRA